jgi:AraC family transcriptional regulator
MKTLFIKNMVCNRCVMVVEQELEKLGLHVEKVTLGEVRLKEDALTASQLEAVDVALKNKGFERIDDRKSRIIEGIKSNVIQLIHHKHEQARKLNWSTILSEELHLEYNYLSSLFSSVEGVTLEHYIINQKIERAKELLFYDELNLTQIADQLGYSSVAHLSAQFKKVTGMTPSELKKSSQTESLRKPLDSVT